MKHKKIVCIIQARTGSTRLPNKVLLDLEGKPVLLRVVDRVLESKKINQVIVATTTKKKDQKIVDLIKNYNPLVSIFRGSEEDVLDRYYQAAKKEKADIIIRITSDCPLIDPEVLDKVINIFLKNKDIDHAANVFPERTYPRGLDVDVLSFKALKKIWHEARDKNDREHVTLYLAKNSNLFKCKNLINDINYSYHRWTIDEIDDYKLIKIIYHELYPKKPNFRMEDVIELFNKKPELIKINQHIEHKHPNSKNKLRIVACIQARMGSSRLKKKSLLIISGKTMVENIFYRLKGAKEVNDIVLATSVKKENDVLVSHAKKIGLKYYRGSEEDLASRIYETAKKFKADALVKITCDCPLVDPGLVDKMVRIYRENPIKIDFLTNCFPPTFPDGLDIDVIPISTLKRVNSEAKNSLDRECFTCYIVKNPQRFRTCNFKNTVDLSSLRWTVDYPEDLILVRKIYKALAKKNKIFTTSDILNFLKKNPQISKINEKRIDNGIVGGIRGGAYHKMVRKLNKSN